MNPCLSTFYANKLLRALLRGEALTTYSKVYLALYTSNPTAANTGTEVKAASYKRVALPQFTVPTTVAGQEECQNPSIVEFPEAMQNWGEITHVAFFSAETGGDFLAFAPMEFPVTASLRTQIIFKPGTLKFAAQ